MTDPRPVQPRILGLNQGLPVVLAFVFMACGGERFTAQSQKLDASVSGASSSTEASASGATTAFVSTPLNPTDGGKSSTQSRAADTGADSLSEEGDGSSVDLPSVTSAPDAGLTNVDTSNEPDASLTETSADENSWVADAATDEPTSIEIPQYPCNDGDFETPREVRGLGFTNNLWGPGISGDGKYLYFGHTEGDEDLFAARLDGSDPTNFERSEPLTTLNTGSSEGTPFVTANGLSIYFYATRQGGPGDRDLWHASREDIASAFGNPELLAGVNDQAYDHLPWLSEDELTLCYTTLRNDGLGQSDIWMATRSSLEEPFSDHKLVPGVNTAAREDAVAFSPDGLTVFFSTDRETDGDLDIWQATRGSLDEDFTDAHVIAGMNSYAEDTNLSLTNDGRHLYFSSGRSGEQRIWVASRSCAAPTE